jgi:hypothetical protein
MTDGQWQRVVKCKDLFKRDSAITVRITDAGEIAIIGPPNGSAIITHGGGDLLKDAIDAAQREANLRARRR